MCKNSVKQVALLRCVIWCFEAASGLKINLVKSCMFGVGEVPDLSNCAEV